MHHAWNGAGIRKVRVFLNGKGIHIRSQGQAFSRSLAAAETLAKHPSLVALPIEEGLETTVILAYGKTAALSAQNKQFMDHIIRNYPKYREG